MTKTIICLTFIPWILYFLSVSLNAVKDLNKNTVTGTWLKENVFNIFSSFPQNLKCEGRVHKEVQKNDKV